MSTLWASCLLQLEGEISSQDFNTWLRPLQVIESKEEFRLLAPNKFVFDWVRENYLSRIQEIIIEEYSNPSLSLLLEIGSKTKKQKTNKKSLSQNSKKITPRTIIPNNLDIAFTFDNFVEGKSNQLAKAASIQVAANVGKVYNPLFIYGGVGLGKTHLMHAIGNMILDKNKSANVCFLNSEKFVADMVKALQHNKIDDFKSYYRTVDALMIDDIQFFAGKERTQEEFFHTFNTLLENKHQIILTCDRYPKEVKGLEERLKSRFGWGLTVAIEPPDLETRVAILMNKALLFNAKIPYEVAFFIGKRIRSNVRELEGALRRVIANADFTGKQITLDFTKEALKDLIALQDRLISVENIQRTVAEYYKIRVIDLLSSKRTRSITRPRQMAMYLAKELTNQSLPEIGQQFGGKDHTTVLHACRRVKELLTSDSRITEDHSNLFRTLTN